MLKSFFHSIIDRLVERYITWKTGETKEQRDFTEWRTVNINYRATTVSDMFKSFPYVVEADPFKLFTHDPFGWILVDDAREYFYPSRPLGKNCYYMWLRVLWDSRNNQWVINDLPGDVRVFVACATEEDAVIISLRFG